MASWAATVINSFQQYTAVRAVTSTTDTMLVSDYGQLVTYNNASPVAVTLPQALAVNSFYPWNAYACDLGAGSATITPTTSTINGAATLVLTKGQCAQIVSDGANYQVISGGINSLTLPVSVANGGTGASSSGATAANNIGALAEANNLSDLNSASTARTNLGLGALATAQFRQSRNGRR